MDKLYINKNNKWYLILPDGQVALRCCPPPEVQEHYKNEDCVVLRTDSAEGTHARVLVASPTVTALSNMTIRYMEQRTELVSLKDALAHAEAAREEAASKKHEDFTTGFACGAFLLGLVGLFVGAVLATDGHEEPLEGIPPESGAKVLFLVLDQGTKASA